jgi:hypothetical protein
MDQIKFYKTDSTGSKRFATPTSKDLRLSATCYGTISVIAFAANSGLHAAVPQFYIVLFFALFVSKVGDPKA